MSIKKSGNNAGVTLIEMLVALAVSSIVMVAAMVLLTNGISSYRTQTITAQIQENADLALTHISDAILEAKVVNVDMADSETGSTKAFYVEKDQEYGYKYDRDSKTLYVVTKDASGNFIESVLCTGVTYFKLQMLSASVEVDDKDGDGEDEIVDVNETVQLKVTIEVEESDITRRAARVTGIRNEMDLDDVVLLGFTVDEYRDVKYLKDYGFLVEE